jgi:tetratricopeptide (TPR) repeat protein
VASPFPGAGESVAARADYMLQQAVFALDSGHPQEAERIAAEVLKTNPRHARASFLVGSALIMQGRATEAIGSLEAAAQGRQDAELDTILAIALRRVGREDEALRRLKRATKRRPPYAAAFHELGCLLASGDRDAEAIEVFRRGLELAPMMPALSIQLGHALLRQRSCVEAKAAFAHALDISPGSPDAVLGIASAHQELGENAPAVEYFRRYLGMRPDDHTAWLHLGHCLLEIGQLDAGYDCFRNAAKGDAKRFGMALSSLTASGRGRMWLSRSCAAQFLRRTVG